MSTDAAEELHDAPVQTFVPLPAENRRVPS